MMPKEWEDYLKLLPGQDLWDLVNALRTLSGFDQIRDEFPGLSIVLVLAEYLNLQRQNLL